VFTRRDVDEQVRPWRAEDAIASGVNDYRSKAVEELGKEVFILTGGVVGTFWHCTWYVGLTNRFMLLRDEPGLIEYLSSRLLEHAIEQVRVLAAAGGDAIYIDDATATCEMISRKDYERFSMPYVREIVREIHAHGMKAIVIYFGGVADRVEQIASLGADGLIVETTMKNYVNDIGDVAARLDGKMCLFGNLDPVGVLWRGTDERLREEVERQAAVGRRYGRFLLSTGSPVTPGTPLARIRRFIDLAHGTPAF
jgi:uroporphyrinogen decarboxylase